MLRVLYSCIPRAVLIKNWGAATTQQHKHEAKRGWIQLSPSVTLWPVALAKGVYGRALKTRAPKLGPVAPNICRDTYSFRKTPSGSTRFNRSLNDLNSG